MSVKEFFVKLPYLCKADNADRFSKVNELIFDYELNNNTVFDRNAIDIKEPFNRIKIAFSFMIGNYDKERTDHCKNIATLLIMNHYKNYHKEIIYDSMISDLYVSIKEKEYKYPDIINIMSADKAMLLDGWNV